MNVCLHFYWERSLVPGFHTIIYECFFGYICKSHLSSWDPFFWIDSWHFNFERVRFIFHSFPDFSKLDLRIFFFKIIVIIEALLQIFAFHGHFFCAGPCFRVSQYLVDFDLIELDGTWYLGIWFKESIALAQQYFLIFFLIFFCWVAEIFYVLFRGISSNLF